MAKKKMIQVPFENVLCDEEFNARTDYDRDYILSLKNSIMESGLLQPIGVTPKKGPDTDDTKQYYLIYGFCRYKAICLIRDELGVDAHSVLDVVLNEGTLEELRDRNLKENIDRKSLKPHEIANAVKKMVNSGLEQRDIAKRLGRPQSWVSYHHKVVTKLGSVAYKAFEAGDLTLEQALNIADVPEDAQDDVVNKVLNAGTRTEARKLAKQASKDAGTRRTYVNKGRPTAKNLAQFVSDASFDAESNKMVETDEAFYNGLAAGMRVALGDLEFEKLTCHDDYTDKDFHAKERKAKEAAKAKAAKAGEKPKKKKTAKRAARKKKTPAADSAAAN
jgi:ParB/RepB/Spo0J family partition protein